MVPETPLPNSVVYWMLFTPVTESCPPSRNDELLPGNPCQGVAYAEPDLPKLNPANWRNRNSTALKPPPGISRSWGLFPRLVFREVGLKVFPPRVLNDQSPCPKVRTTPYSVAVRVSTVSAIRERSGK